VPFELFVALRYLRDGRSQTLLILAAAAVGVGVVIFTSSLLSGLQRTLVDKTLGSQPHIVLRAQDEAARPLARDQGPGTTVSSLQKPELRPRTISDWQQTRDALAHDSRIVALAPTVNGSAIVSRGNVGKSVTLRGIEPDNFGKIIPVFRKMVAGRFQLSGTDAVIGSELASDLGTSIGEKIRITTAEGGDDVLTVTGIFDLGNKEVNQRWVFVPLRLAQTLLDMLGKVSGIEIKVNRIFEAEAIAKSLEAKTGLVADSWMKLNTELLIGLKSQDSSGYMIEFFIMVAVALGIASVLIISVVQKSKEIGIMRAFGTRARRVLTIFLIQGAMVGFLGALLGLGVGSVLALAFSRLAVNPDGSPTFPVDLTPRLFLSAIIVSTSVGIIASIFPARKAARLDPTSVIKNG
jgi:lipoprotein-releasing system permease protein